MLGITASKFAEGLSRLAGYGEAPGKWEWGRRELKSPVGTRAALVTHFPNGTWRWITFSPTGQPLREGVERTYARARDTAKRDVKRSWGCQPTRLLR